MHPYTNDGLGGPKLIAALALAAPSIALALNTPLQWLKVKTGVSVVEFSTMAIFTGLYLLFDRFAWRIPIARRLLLVPNLNGTWVCEGKTVFKRGGAVEFEWHGTITIVQSWSRIAITLQTAQSRSDSLAASIRRVPTGGFRLVYHYVNDPDVDQVDLAHHKGLCQLSFAADCTSATGDYFTDRDRMTVGTMTLRMEPKHGKA